VPFAPASQQERAGQKQAEHERRAHRHRQELQRIAARRCVAGGDASDAEIEGLNGQHGADEGGEDAEPHVDVDAICGDELCLGEMQHEPERREDAVDMRDPAEWWQVEPDPEVVGPREAHDHDGGQRGGGDEGEAVAKCCGVHGPAKYSRPDGAQ
jgi:hypothetical protein